MSAGDSPLGAEFYLRKLWEQGVAQAEAQGIGSGRVTIENVATSLSMAHRKIHDGDTFIISGLDIAVVDDGTLIIAWTVPADLDMHCTFAAACGGDATLELLRSPTITGGTPLVTFPKKQTLNPRAPAVNTPLLNPTINNDGIPLPSRLIPGGTGGNASGGDVGSRDEWDFEIPTIFALRLTNISGNTKPASLIVEWYELPE